MKKSKRLLSVILTAILLAGLLAACGGDKADSGNSGNTGESSPQAGASGSSDGGGETVELTFWRHDFAPEANSLNKMIASFQEKHPNIKVKFEQIPNDQYETKLRTSLAAGNPPDILALDGPTLASYAHQGALHALDDYLKEDGEMNDIAKPVLQSLTYQGKVYAVPSNDASLAVFYNKKMFQEKGVAEPPKDPNDAWTWQQYLDAAKKLNDPGKGIYGMNPNPWGFVGHEGVPFADMTWIWQAGGEILSPDGKTSKGYLDSAETKKALTFYQSLFNTENVAPKELPADPFPNGKVAIHVDGPWAFGSWAANFPDFKLGENYEVAPLWKDVKQVSPNGSWNLAIAAKSEHHKEAWMFVNWVTGVEGSKTWYEDTKNLPARLSTASAFPELQEYPMNIFVEQSAKYAHPRPITPAYPAISEAVRLLFEDVGLAGANVDEAVGRAVEKIEKGLAVYNK